MYIVEFSPPGRGGGIKSKVLESGEENQRQKKKGKKIKEGKKFRMIKKRIPMVQ